MIYILDKALIVSMHKKQISLYGGILGIRDEGLLDSTIAAPFQTFANVELFPTIEEKAAHLVYGLIQNHAFILSMIPTKVKTQIKYTWRFFQ